MRASEPANPAFATSHLCLLAQRPLLHLLSLMLAVLRLQPGLGQLRSAAAAPPAEPGKAGAAYGWTLPCSWSGWRQTRRRSSWRWSATCSRCVPVLCLLSMLCLLCSACCVLPGPGSAVGSNVLKGQGAGSSAAHVAALSASRGRRINQQVHTQQLGPGRMPSLGTHSPQLPLA